MKRRLFRVIICCRKVLCRVANAPVIAVQRLMECMDAVHWVTVVAGIVFLSTFFILSYRLNHMPSREDMQGRQVEEILSEPRPCDGKDRRDSHP